MHHSETYPRVEIDVSAFRHNLHEVRNKISGDTKIIAMVKADAYGHGANVLAVEAEKFGVHSLAVARVHEAEGLRKYGVKLPILLLGACEKNDLKKYLQYEIIPSVTSLEDGQELSKACGDCRSSIAVHVKVDTGMGRHGIHLEPGESAEIIEKISALPNLNVQGIYSHLANADIFDKSHARSQIEKFAEIKKFLEVHEKQRFLYHIANSAGIMDLPESHFDMVRPGIMLYGLYPSAEISNSEINILPVMSFKTKITQIKEVPSGFPISYGSTHITERPSKIATVPVGYADGYSRLLSSRGEMLVRGGRASVVGRVCMDLTMLDVTDIPRVSLGDEVVVIGRQEKDSISADEIAQKTGTINYEVLSNISHRVPRIYR